MIKDLIKELAKNEQEIYGVVCRVKSINIMERTCEVEPINGDPNLFDVKLQADISRKDGLVIIPVINSNVVVCFLNETAAIVVLTSEIEKTEVKISDKTMVLSSKGLSVKSNVSDLKTELNKLIDEIDMLYNLISEPNLFLAGQVPVIISPAAVPKIAQNKIKIKKIKEAVNSFLTS